MRKHIWNIAGNTRYLPLDEPSGSTRMKAGTPFVECYLRLQRVFMLLHVARVTHSQARSPSVRRCPTPELTPVLALGIRNSLFT